MERKQNSSEKHKPELPTCKDVFEDSLQQEKERSHVGGLVSMPN